MWSGPLTLLILLPYSSFKYKKHLHIHFPYYNAVLFNVSAPGDCYSWIPWFCEWLLPSEVQTKKEEASHVHACSLFIWFISSPHWWKLKWSQETRRLAATQVAPRGTNKYKCRTREQGSFLDRQCLCRSILLASCNSGDSLFLQWNSGSLSLLNLQLRGQCTRGSAWAVWTTLDMSVETFLTILSKRLF